MAKFIMNINNINNIKAMEAWCNQYHIQYQIIEDNAPQLVDESVSTPTVKATAKSTTKTESEFPKLADKADETVGVITRYGKFVRNWEVGMDGKVGGYVMDKVKYATKKAITEAGASWDKDKKAYAFPKVSDAKAFMAAQKERAKKASK